MYSGIIEDLGRVERVKASPLGAVLSVKTALPTGKIRIGDSISINGVCLTVIGRARGRLEFDLSAETMRRSTLGGLKCDDPVNIERCISLNTLMNGHMVAGHVDGIGRVVSIKPEGDSKLFILEVPASEARYLVEKGSVTLDGISLTVFAIDGRRFSCALIPHTLKVTTMGFKAPGDRVNIEIDMVAKYVEKFVGERLAAAAGAEVAGR